MNREEAIITLTNTASLLRDGTRYMKPEHERQFREAYEMAIKALQPEQLQDKCEGCYYKDRMGYQCESCARYFPDRYMSEGEGG